MKWNQALDSLDACEAALRKLLAESAGEGDYLTVQRIANLARALAALAAEGRAGSSVQTIREDVGTPGQNEQDTHIRSASSGHSALRTQPSSRSRKHPPADTYPRFFRRGDELVKVGWSKKDRREYNHRAPRRAVEAAAAAVRTVGARGRLFNGDALLPLKHPADNAAIPDYQAYVALAWLRHLGIVQQRGRKAGYALVPTKPIDSIITAAWPELAEWRG